MVKGPWFFDSFGGGWRFVPEERDGVAGTQAVWKYTYAVQADLASPGRRADRPVAARA